MRLHRDLSRLVWLSLLLSLALSCAQTHVIQLPEGPYFVTPRITYLLDRPTPDGNVLSPLFRGDKLDLVDGSDSTWWLVKLQRTRQTGWVRKELLTLAQTPTDFYYVKKDTLPLLECPRNDCIPLQLLFWGDVVQKIEEGEQGWWRVLAIKGRSLGWVQASALTKENPKARQQPRRLYYYVAIRELVLRAQPSPKGEAIRTLRFNNQLQKLDETKGWFKVRQPSSGAVGWVFSRDLEPMPLISPRGMPTEKNLRPFKQKEESLPVPDFM